MLILISLIPLHAQFAGGSGTEDDPYQIATIEQLQQMSYQKGESNYTAFRCPSMVVTKEGTILAFAEGRYVSWRDHEAMDDLVVKRSTDGGQTWGPLKVAAEYGEDAAKNASPVVLPSGRILLVYNFNEDYGPDKSARDGREVHMVYSDDDGVTWSEPRNITPMVYEDDWIWHGIGPGHGIVKEREPHKGRIIVAARHNPGKGISGSSYIMYSDDEGETWEIGAFSLRDQTNESMAVELSTGEIMVNHRNGRSEEPYRCVSISSDGGETFDTFYVDQTLIEPQGCMGSILKHSFNEETGKYNLLFSNPHHTVERVRGSIKLSPDDGKTGTKMYMYSDPYPRFSGYSDIGVLNDEGDIGVLWETGSHYQRGLRYDGVVFKRVKFSHINVPIDEVEQTYYGDSTPNPHPAKDYVWVFDTRPKHYIQIADIDASETENWNDGQGFDPIGDYDNAFNGWYDGNGYTIENLTIDRSGENVGLFGWAGGGEIRNVVLENANITGGDLTGGLVGRLTRGRIVDSHVSGRVSGGNSTGGLVGRFAGGSIIDSHVSGTVSGDDRVGGLVGHSRQQRQRQNYIINSDVNAHVSEEKP